MTSPHALLQAEGIEGGYGRRAVLHGIDVELHAGEMVALLGPNGAGKTTLMKILVGLLAAKRGTVDGPSGRRVGWVPQGGATYQRMTVRENLELFARLLHLPGSPRDVARTAATAGDLLPWFNSLGSELSGGLRQRLNVTVGLLGDPDLLVLDEPTTGVDLVHRTALYHLLRSRADEGCSVLYSTHAVEDAAAADRVIVLVGGVIAYDGTLEGVADVAGTSPAKYAALDPVSRGLLRLWAGDPSEREVAR
ncbi:MAG: multidrug transporter ATPase [Thermoleophilia bacterium]|nr:multidrug transporter ATPase [Thermoleophilia bacterium]